MRKRLFYALFMWIRIRICQGKASLRPLLSKRGWRSRNLNEGPCQFIENNILKKMHLWLYLPYLVIYNIIKKARKMWLKIYHVTHGLTSARLLVVFIFNFLFLFIFLEIRRSFFIYNKSGNLRAGTNCTLAPYVNIYIYYLLDSDSRFYS